MRGNGGGYHRVVTIAFIRTGHPIPIPIHGLVPIHPQHARFLPLQGLNIVPVRYTVCPVRVPIASVAYLNAVQQPSRVGVSDGKIVGCSDCS